MTIILTMAGQSKRFKIAGYIKPKYEIEVNGKTLFEWSLDSLLGYNSHVDRYIFITLKSNSAKKFIENKIARYNIKNFSIYELNKSTDGQATTALFGIQNIAGDEPILIYNIDTYIEPYILRYEDIKGDGFIPCFAANGDHSSFVSCTKEKLVTKVAEKSRISNNCSIGAYYFSSTSLYKKAYTEYYLNLNNNFYKEKYIAPIYNYLISINKPVYMNIINSSAVHVLGTPEELDIFKNNYSISNEST